jgi:hypothetical protein
MKGFMRILFAITPVLIAGLCSAHGQGAVTLGNTMLSQVKIELASGQRVNVPAGYPIVYGLFWGDSPDNLHLNSGPLGTASTTTAGIITAPSPYIIEGAPPGSQVWMQIRGWSASLGRDWNAAQPSQGYYYGETARRLITLGSNAAPTILWSMANTNLFQALLLKISTGPVEYRLVASSSPGGSVTRTPDLTNYPGATSVALTPVPDAGYAFLRWQGHLSGSENPATLVMDTNKSVLAVFASLAISPGVHGSGSIIKSPDLPYYTLGQSVALEAQPDRWWAFSRWTDGSTENPRIIVIGESNSYTAVFIPAVPLETVTLGEVTRVAPIGMPAILVDGLFQVGSNVFVRGAATVTLFSTFPNASLVYTLDGSVPDFTGQFYAGPFPVHRSVIVRAVAYSDDFTQAVQSDPLAIQVLPSLTVSTPGGGAIAVDPPIGAYRPDGTVTLTASAAPGWVFLQWLGASTEFAPVTTVAMTHDQCAQAIFGTSVNTSVVGSGSIVRDRVGPLYPYGTSVRLIAVPDAGNYFAFWGNAGTGTNNPLTSSITASNPTIAAVFAPLSTGNSALTIIPDGFGRVETAPRGNRFSSGANVTLSAIPEAGQAFLGWSGSASGNSNPLVVSMTQSRTIVAEFSSRPTLAPLLCQDQPPLDEFQLLLIGVPGGNYFIEASTNLLPSSWIQIGTVLTPYGSGQLTERLTESPSSRTYRAIVAPIR